MNRIFLHGLFGDMAMPNELTDKFTEELKSKGLVHYDILEIHSKINLKGLISGDVKMRAASKITDWEELEIVHCLKLCSNWKDAINTMLHKWQILNGWSV